MHIQLYLEALGGMELPSATLEWRAACLQMVRSILQTRDLVRVLVLVFISEFPLHLEALVNIKLPSATLSSWGVRRAYEWYGYY